MSKREKFINVVKEMFRKFDVSTFIGNEDEEKEVLSFLEELKAGGGNGALTETGTKIIKYMQDNPNTILFTSKSIGDGIFLSSRSVSGSMQKLVKDGYCYKEGKDPIKYGLTDDGKTLVIDK